MSYVWDAKKLQKLMDVTEMTIEETAKACGISAQAIAKYRNGKARPSADAIYALAEFFAVPADYLLGLTQNEEAIEAHYPEIWQQIKRSSYEEYLRRTSAMSGRHCSIPDGYVSPWPYNLVEQIMSGGSTEVPVYDKVLTDDNLAGLAYALDTLTERERSMLLKYYQENQTLEDIARGYDVGRERIRQIIAKGVRKLRHPSRRYLITEGLSGYKLVQEQKRLDCRERELEERCLKLDELEAQLEDRAKQVQEQYGIVLQNVNETPIVELDLSVRTFNCLNRKGFKTINDVIVFNTKNPMNMIRNLGYKSFLEIKDIVKDRAGVELCFKQTM